MPNVTCFSLSLTGNWSTSTGYVVVTSTFLVITPSYLVATIGYFWLPVVPGFNNKKFL